MTDQRARDFTQLLGERLRDLRHQVGLRQEDVGQRMEALGFEWTRRTVTSMESGHRRVYADELLGLQVVLGTSVGDLLGDVGQVRVANEVIDASRFRFTVEAKGRRGDDWLSVGEEIAAMVSEFKDEEQRLRRRLEERGLIRQAADDAEQKAARRLGIDPKELVRLAISRWGLPLSAERDRRVADLYGESDPRTLQAQRGHITRALIEELRSALEFHRTEQ